MASDTGRGADRRPPDPITELIARRVAQLRGHGEAGVRARMSGAALAARMTDLGIPWTRTTVAKLESGRRAALTVQELLVLARALDVPPVWLLCDPAATEPTTITDEVSAGAWSTLLWLVGREPLDGRDDDPGPAWNRAEKAIACGHLVVRCVLDLREVRGYRERYGQAETSDGHDPDLVQEQRLFAVLNNQLDIATDAGFKPPPVPDDIRARAAEIGIRLRDGR